MASKLTNQDKERIEEIAKNDTINQAINDAKNGEFNPPPSNLGRNVVVATLLTGPIGFVAALVGTDTDERDTYVEAHNAYSEAKK